jgi:antitoxin ParD1/3/4
MTQVLKRTFSLSDEQARYIDEKVASGSYASPSEVVRAGLRALEERDSAIERWLIDEVAPAYDAIKSDSARAIPAEAVFSEVRRRGRLDKSHR